MARILYVVHRYAPYPGGSENYVRDMAEETLSRGHEVCVFAGEHKGNLNGVRVTDLVSVLNEKWDLVVVHGGDVHVQDFVLRNAKHMQSPVLFMLIVPSESKTYLDAIKDVEFIGCSTKEDYVYVNSKGIEALHKSRMIRHGIDTKISLGTPGFRQRHNITTKYMFLSCGGFWPNKAFPELIDVFKQVRRDDITLVLTGYDNRHNIKPEDSEFVKVLMLDDRQEVLDAIKEADLYIMHSHKEGFGLVLLESMYNSTAWAARNLAGARLLSEFGYTYDNDLELLEYMKSFQGVPEEKIDDALEYMIHNHTIQSTVDDILKLI